MEWFQDRIIPIFFELRPSQLTRMSCTPTGRLGYFRFDDGLLVSVRALISLADVVRSILSHDQGSLPLLMSRFTLGRRFGNSNLVHVVSVWISPALGKRTCALGVDMDDPLLASLAA